MKRLLPLLGLMLIGSSALAAGKVRLEVPITYHAEASVNDKVKAECKVENLLAQHISGALATINQGTDNTVEASAGTSAGDDQVLKVQITYVFGAGGGAWSGPKSLTVAAELLEKGKVLHKTKVTRSTTGGAFGGFKGTCSLLDRSAKTIGSDLAKWVQTPTSHVGE